MAKTRVCVRRLNAGHQKESMTRFPPLGKEKPIGRRSDHSHLDGGLSRFTRKYPTDLYPIFPNDVTVVMGQKRCRR